ncbi:MAG TPA: glycosyltransferase [Methanocellaceae archaeon]
MRVAIFHDYFSFIGGGEKLVLTLARHLNADIITTNVDYDLISRMGFDDVRVISLGTLTGIEPLKQIQATWKFAACDFRGKYDFYIFSGNWAHHASKRHRPNLYYCHAHVRVFYDLKEQTVKALRNPLKRLLARAWIYAHSYYDKRSIARVDRIVANSRCIARRIKKYLGRESVVVYPPSDTSRFEYAGDEGFWLSVNRLFPEKRIEVQLGAFARMPDQNLVIIGGGDRGEYSGSYARMIKENLPPNVRLVSDLPEEKLIEYYGRCRGFIATSENEPFGMAAVEAMASGKPVIAVNEGGFVESVLDGRTGRLIRCSEDELIRAVREVGRYAADFRDACIARSKKFDVSAFFSAMDALIAEPSGLQAVELDPEPMRTPVRLLSKP